ncbi:MAG: UPF0175 family protein [Planctomycetes bacterium]|nr:UPF0175 family protein [Planctomycetota bacterium]
MKIEIPDELAEVLPGDESSVLVEIVLGLYKACRISSGKARELLRTDVIGFQRLLADRGLDLNFSAEELERETRAADEILTKLAPK